MSPIQHAAVVPSFKGDAGHMLLAERCRTYGAGKEAEATEGSWCPCLQRPTRSRQLGEEMLLLRVPFATVPVAILSMQEMKVRDVNFGAKGEASQVLQMGDAASQKVNRAE
jgi:hypothetical protein